MAPRGARLAGGATAARRRSRTPPCAAAGLTDWRYQLLPASARAVRRAGPGAARRRFSRGQRDDPPQVRRRWPWPPTPPPAPGRSVRPTRCVRPTATITADNTDAAGPDRRAAVPSRRRHRAGPRRGRQRSRRGLGAARRRRGRGPGLEPHAPSGRGRWPGSSGATPVVDASPADLLVNCTSVGLDGSGSLEGLPLSHGRPRPAFGCVVDFVYAPAATGLIVRGRRARASPPSTGSSCWSARARSASSCSPASRLAATRCAPRSVARRWLTSERR